MQVKEIPIASIIVKDRIRTDPGDLASLAQSIKKQGLLQPIVVDESMRLLVGGRRYEAHKLLGLSYIRATIMPNGTAEERMVIEHVENAQRKDLEWQEKCDEQRRLWDHMIKTDRRWTQQKQAALTGQSQSMVSDLLRLADRVKSNPDLAKHKHQKDALKQTYKDDEVEFKDALINLVPEMKDAIKEASKHYHIGDAFSGMEDLLSQSTKPFDFAEVDSPFGVDLDKSKARNNVDQMSNYHEWDKSEFEAKFLRLASLVYQLLSEHSFAVFWYGPTWHHEVKTILRQVGFQVSDIPAVWYKTGIGGQTNQPDYHFGSAYEPFFLARKGKPVLAKPGRSNVFAFDVLRDKVHPTEKPIGLIKEIIETVALPSSRILIPFLGSGVTLRAAYQLHCTGIGWDLEPGNKKAFESRVADDLRELFRNERQAS